MQSWCIRCGEAHAVDGLGYCSHCHWATRAEFEQGYQRILDYLACWARFREWEAEHPVEG